MSSRSARVLRAIEESNGSEAQGPTQPRRRPAVAPKDPLPPEERAALRMLSEFEGVVCRSTMGPIIEKLRLETLHMSVCPHCVSGWVFADNGEESNSRRNFESRVSEYSRQELENARSCLERESRVSGVQFTEQSVRSRAEAMGRDRALLECRGDPAERSQVCEDCNGTGLLPTRPPKRVADPDCQLCQGLGVIPGPRYVVFTPNGFSLFKHTQPCLCLAETARPMGSSTGGHSAVPEGPDPEWLARVGKQSRRLSAVGTRYALALDAWYSPSGERLECLWPLTESGRAAIRGMLRDPRKWRADARVRKGGELLVRQADAQAKQLLSAARKAWITTLELSR
jgi:hypothetical protein